MMAKLAAIVALAAALYVMTSGDVVFIYQGF